MTACITGTFGFDGIGLFLGLVAFIAVFAISIAFWQSTAEEPRPLRKRAMIASGLAAAIPTMFPALIVLIVDGASSEALLIAVVLLVLAVFLAAMIGFPVAYLAGRFFDRRRSQGKQAE